MLDDATNYYTLKKAFADLPYSIFLFFLWVFMTRMQVFPFHLPATYYKAIGEIAARCSLFEMHVMHPEEPTNAFGGV